MAFCPKMFKPEPAYPNIETICAFLEWLGHQILDILDSPPAHHARVMPRI